MLFVFFHGAVINDIFDGMSATALRILAYVSALSQMRMTLLILGERADADDAAVEGLVELEVLLLRALHVHSVDHVVLKLQMFVRLVLLVKSSVHANCLSSLAAFGAAWYHSSMCDGCLVHR